MVLVVCVVLFLVTASRELPGSYYRGDGRGYNIYLDLLPDGTYTAEWQGCLGLYGTARGAWKRENKKIVFSPSEEKNMMKGHLRELHITHGYWRPVLVPDLNDELYRKAGVNKYTAFQKRNKYQGKKGEDYLFLVPGSEIR